MKTLRAHVEGGKVVVDDDVGLPDGTVLHLVVADGDDDLDPAERERLHDALRASWKSAEAGEKIPIESLLAELRTR